MKDLKFLSFFDYLKIVNVRIHIKSLNNDFMYQAKIWNVYHMSYLRYCTKHGYFHEYEQWNHKVKEYGERVLKYKQSLLNNM